MSLREAITTYYEVNNAVGAVHATGGGVRTWKIKVEGGTVYLRQGASTMAGTDVVVPAASGDACDFAVLNPETDRITTTDAALALRTRPGVTAVVHITFEG